MGCDPASNNPRGAIVTNDNRYNGWTNYATWRVVLEIFDNVDAEYFTDETGTGDAYSLSQRLEEFADNVISFEGENEGFAVDFARAFLKEVNWYEIAEHMLENAKA